MTLKLLKPAIQAGFLLHDVPGANHCSPADVGVPEGVSALQWMGKLTEAVTKAAKLGSLR